nr:unnamed protein product [Spirometra erinaceieuropaei]
MPPTDELTQLSPKDLNTDETKSSEPSSPRRTPAPYYHAIPSSFHIFDGEEDFGDWLNLLDFYLEEVPDNEKSRALLKHLAIPEPTVEVEIGDGHDPPANGPEDRAIP